MNKQIIEKELVYIASRSSGAGGQHVNKVATKVQLQFRIEHSLGLSEEEKQILLSRLSNRITQEKILQLSSSHTRSQLKNKMLVTQRFWEVLEGAFKKPKKRILTKIPRAVIEKRLREKKTLSKIKQLRKKDSY